MAGVVTKHLSDLIAKQVEDYKLVVWYDPECAYSDAVANFELVQHHHRTIRRQLSSAYAMRSTICSTAKSHLVSSFTFLSIRARRIMP